jgi:hypothetical protein
MRHAIRLSLALIAICLGMVFMPSHGQADASCDAVVAGLPLLTPNIQTQWIVDTCSARTSVRITLSELRGGDWERADCDGGTDNCTTIRPTGVQDCGDGSLFCAYTTINRTETWDQDTDPCNRFWRTKVVVRNPSGDVIASDVSGAVTC